MYLLACLILRSRRRQEIGRRGRVGGGKADRHRWTGVGRRQRRGRSERHRKNARQASTVVTATPIGVSRCYEYVYVSNDVSSTVLLLSGSDKVPFGRMHTGTYAV